MTQYCPVFEKDGNRLIVRTEEFVGKDEEQAKHIGWGAMLVECILLKMKYTGDIISIDGEIPHVAADLGSVPVAILSGPVFDEQENLTCPPYV